ncbi:hypothetical protein PCL1606_25390 [Pseudomonas chlororaphis]|uniref:Uncharacterized protein n=1 Tax=Pseudomonas chlororaphis TaxID=587753 RepID=A0A0D5XZ36_9PSED|nr:hypothetical protein PCL1606_25390 [Pseudomonas chlororaphis]
MGQALAGDLFGQGLVMDMEESQRISNWPPPWGNGRQGFGGGVKTPGQ